jgi:ferredoxin
MVKTVKLEPIAVEASIATNTNLLSALLSNELKVSKVCGGRGLCATCHIYVDEGEESLSPMNSREQRTLGVITTCRANSRLACQARVIGEGVVVQLPSGMYVSEVDNIEDLVGKRAQRDILHPLLGKVLVEEGKLITRSMLNILENARTKSDEYLNQNHEA